MCFSVQRMTEEELKGYPEGWQGRYWRVSLLRLKKT
jgi:hypothetical protein